MLFTTCPHGLRLNNRMTVPLQDYKPVDLGARRDDGLQRKPEKYFLSIFFAALLTNSIVALLYSPAYFRYQNIIRVVGLIALVASIVISLVRIMRARRLTH